MSEKYFEGTVPGSKSAEEFSILESIKPAAALIENASFTQAVETIQRAIDLTNRHIERSAPWKMAKENNPALPQVIRELLRAIRIISVYLLPFMPDTSKRIWLLSGKNTGIEEAALKVLSGDESAAAAIATVEFGAGLLRPGGAVSEVDVKNPVPEAIVAHMLLLGGSTGLAGKDG